jgi:hypothetical protein
VHTLLTNISNGKCRFRCLRWFLALFCSSILFWNGFDKASIKAPWTCCSHYSIPPAHTPLHERVHPRVLFKYGVCCSVLGLMTGVLLIFYTCRRGGFCQHIVIIALVSYIGFEVLTTVVMKSSVFWDMTPSSPLEVNRRLGGTYRLQNPRLMNNWVFCLVYYSILKEATCSSETSVHFQWTTLRYIPEQRTLPSQIHHGHRSKIRLRRQSKHRRLFISM